MYPLPGAGNKKSEIKISALSYCKLKCKPNPDSNHHLSLSHTLCRNPYPKPNKIMQQSSCHTQCKQNLTVMWVYAAPVTHHHSIGFIQMCGTWHLAQWYLYSGVCAIVSALCHFSFMQWLMSVNLSYMWHFVLIFCCYYYDSGTSWAWYATVSAKACCYNWSIALPLVCSVSYVYELVLRGYCPYILHACICVVSNVRGFLSVYLRCPACSHETFSHVRRYLQTRPSHILYYTPT